MLLASLLQSARRLAGTSSNIAHASIIISTVIFLIIIITKTAQTTSDAQADASGKMKLEDGQRNEHEYDGLWGRSGR